MIAHGADIDRAIAALNHVPPTDREIWIEMGMALHAEFSDDGFEPWFMWSRGDSRCNLAECQTQWRSFNAGGGIGIGTLYRLAQEHGWQGSGGSTYTAPSEEVREARERAKEAEAAELAARQDRAAEQARQYWDIAVPADDTHPYLKTKGVRSHGLRVDAHGNLVVPGYCNKALRTIQTISPDGSRKTYWTGSQKQGCSFPLTKPDTPPHAIGIGEGYSTCASVHEATGLPMVTCFDASNMLPVALSVRESFPTVKIILCADNDLFADGRKNAGLLAATEAAKAVKGFLAVPDMDGTKCDFNDLHQAKGAEAVAAAIQNAVPAYRPRPLNESNFAVPACDLLAEEPEPVEYILDEYLATGSLNVMVGKPKEGKSSLNYELSVSIAKGEPFLGRTTKKSGVLILAVEEHRRDVQVRLHNLGADNLQNLYLKIGPLSPSPAFFTEIQDFIQEHDIKLVILDTLAAFWKVENENDASQVTKAVKPLLQLARESGACVVLIHHARKSEGSHGDEIRGSGALFGLVDVALVMKRHHEKNQRLLQAQSRYPETPAELVLELRDSGYVAIGDPASTNKQAKIDKLLSVLPHQWEAAGPILKRAGLKRVVGYQLLSLLVDQGQALRDGEGKKGSPHVYQRNSIRSAPPVYRGEQNTNEMDGATDLIRSAPVPPERNEMEREEAPSSCAKGETGETSETDEAGEDYDLC